MGATGARRGEIRRGQEGVRGFRRESGRRRRRCGRREAAAGPGGVARRRGGGGRGVRAGDAAQAHGRVRTIT